MREFEIIKRPIITEKSTSLREGQNKLTLEVAPQANKVEIKKAVQELFRRFRNKDVKVLKVRTMNVRGKRKRMGRHEGKRPDWKKAIVTLAPGDSPELFDGL